MSGKKFGIFYNQQFNVYMVALTPNVTATSVEKKDNVFVLKNQDQIIGFNIFPTKSHHQATTSFCSEIPSIVHYVEQKVRPFMKLEQKPQFLIAKILNIEPIANTHLSRCELDIGQEQPIQVVTGASNASANQYSVFATNGAWLPSSQVISEQTMHGYETKGMLCSANELHLKDSKFNPQGIINLPDNYYEHLGQSFWKVYYGDAKS